ncbi:MAG: hypothetical protein IT210_24430 [Armatimonadetes bacterium]|nr:hypothetical protein [Armatimonadota bacterium]
MKPHPLAEVFGFPVDNLSDEAERYRANRLCPFNNKIPNCTKDRAEDPLGVCSIFHGNDLNITCPVRFREDWIIATDAAKFFFPEGSIWTSLTEVTLPDKYGKSAGNIDVILASYDERGRITEYGALEIQAVYISGNIRNIFQLYMDNPSNYSYIDWRKRKNYPRPDYLSSSRKRLAPQLIFKGGILHTWQRKMAVALNSGFFNTLPDLEDTDSSEADIAWFIYDLKHDSSANRYTLQLSKVVYTKFEPALLRITRSEAGMEEAFIHQLQSHLNRKLDIRSGLDTMEIPF